MTDLSKPTYLGDGVYAEFDGFYIHLKVNDPNSDRLVAIEDYTAVSLIVYMVKCFGQWILGQKIYNLLKAQNDD